jgi:hypothetical protein
VCLLVLHKHPSGWIETLCHHEACVPAGAAQALLRIGWYDDLWAKGPSVPLKMVAALGNVGTWWTGLHL